MHNTRRTLFILSVIAIGLASILVISAIFRGAQESMLQRELCRMTGHLQIHSRKYLSAPAAEHSFLLQRELLYEVFERSRVRQFAIRVKLPAIAMSKKKTSEIMLLGIDPAMETHLSFIGKGVQKGSPLSSSKDQGIIIGAKLAEKLQTNIGERIVVVGSDENNQFIDCDFRVAGVFKNDTSATELQFVFTGLATAQKCFKLEDKVSEIAVLMEDRNDANKAIAILKRVFPDLDIKSWYDLEPTVVAVMKSGSSFIWLCSLVVSIAVVCGLIRTLSIAIFERFRKLRLFQAFGVRISPVVYSVLVESAVMIVWGALIGNILGLSCVLLLSRGIDLSAFASGIEMVEFGQIVYPFVCYQDVVIANAIIILLCLLSSLYSLLRVSRSIVHFDSKLVTPTGLEPVFTA